MKSIILFTALIVLFTKSGICQFRDEKSQISYTKIKDSVLINNINELVSRQIKQDTSKSNLFKQGYGYIFLSIKEYSQSDTLRQYYITPQLLSYKDDRAENSYPDFYSFVNNRLVLIKINVLDAVTQRTYLPKEKKKIRNLVNSQLEKTKRVTFYDVNNKKAFTDKNFRIDYPKFHSGVFIYILKDKPPVIINER